jgi:3-deoxy-manno-octulosonate cytidylyltransferase (CMP-KDO synthetase)
MKILGIIPARIGSTRLPRKPLHDFFGKTMINRCLESCHKSEVIKDFIVATDSEEIIDHVTSLGFRGEMTGSHESGTLRAIEIFDRYKEYDYFVNIQGDHPLLNKEHIDLVSSDLKKSHISTPIVKLTKKDELFNPSVVKVIKDYQDYAIYFSRNPIPYVRDFDKNFWLEQTQYYKHLGIYGFSRLASDMIKSFSKSKLESDESLEQLTWIYNGMKISTVEVQKDLQAVDTLDDVNIIKELILNKEFGE